MGSDEPLGITSPSRASVDPDPSRLAPDQVHVWVASLDSAAAESPRRVAVTTDAERERAARFHRREDAERYLLAHGALRLVLADYLACDPMTLRFGARENGKPFVENVQLEFNLSHSNSLALIAVTRARRVGVDVELLRPIADLETVVARVCAPDELAMFAGLPRAQHERAFLALWTRKEALAKATGEGIGGVFRDASEPAPEAHGTWTVTELDDLPGYAAAVAAEGAGWRLVRCGRLD
jgi:4'-phosphopantetheinyl transferase